MRACRRGRRRRAESAGVLRRQAIENVSRSARTSRAAFSWRSNPAEVCRQNKCGLSQLRTWRAICTSPWSCVEIGRISTAWRIGLFAAIELASALGTFRGFWRCWGARAPKVAPRRGQNAAYHPYHFDHSGGRRPPVSALQHGLGLHPVGGLGTTLIFVLILACWATSDICTGPPR